jgi:predicted transporter
MVERWLCPICGGEKYKQARVFDVNKHTFYFRIIPCKTCLGTGLITPEKYYQINKKESVNVENQTCV